MDVIVGFGPAHDRLLAAALTGCGIPARAAAPPSAEALALGRAVMSRGHPCSTYYIAGSIALHAREIDPQRALRFVTPGDRCGAYATDLERALDAAGFAGARVITVAPERGAEALVELLGDSRERGVESIIEAIGAADALTLAASRALPCGDEARIVAATRAAEHALAAGRPAHAALKSYRARPARLVDQRTQRARVRVTGELLTAAYDAPGAGLLRWMESRGFEAERPTLTEWVVYGAWRMGVRGGVARALRERICEAGERCSEALGAQPFAPLDPTAWLDSAREWLPLTLCAGSGFLEIATYLDTDRTRSADLVLSLKPFASITSSAASDAVLYALSRQRATPFLALELNGDLAVQLQSRVELALQSLPRRPIP